MHVTRKLALSYFRRADTTEVAVGLLVPNFCIWTINVTNDIELIWKRVIDHNEVS